MQTIATLLSGFSIFSALLLAIAHLNCGEYKGKLLPKLAGLLLLASLALLQLSHYQHIVGNSLWVESSYYITLLFLVAPSFYFFSRQILKIQPQNNSALPLTIIGIHYSPALLGFLLPHYIGLPLAFMVGSGYVIWVAHQVYLLREQRTRFKQEIIALGLLFFIATSVIVIAIIEFFIHSASFYLLYATLIGGAFFIADLTLLQSPNITSDVEEAVKATYISSTLTQIDCDKRLNELNKLMEKEKLFTNETLNLAEIAELINLTPHQLSELINSKLNKGFSRYIREFRIAEAKRQLVEEPKASVLSIGLSVGFTSQSNFYNAFKEITGAAPGQYRKDTLKNL